MSTVARNLVGLGGVLGLDEDAACATRAAGVGMLKHAHGLDPIVGSVRGIGPALFAYMRMRCGADALKPDLRVRNALRSVGYWSCRWRTRDSRNGTGDCPGAGSAPLNWTSCSGGSPPDGLTGLLPFSWATRPDRANRLRGVALGSITTIPARALTGPAQGPEVSW